MQRAAIAFRCLASVAGENGFGLVGLLQGEFFANGDVGVDFWIDPPDSFKESLCELDWRELPRAEEFSDLCDGGESELFVSDVQKIFSILRRFPNVPMLARTSATRN